MFLLLTPDKTLNEVQEFFTGNYPYLKLDFYSKRIPAHPAASKRNRLNPVLRLQEAGLSRSGLVDIDKGMTVAELEQLFRKDFGLDVQVSRRSGLLWLETTMTDQWSLSKQNEHGREISVRPNV